MIHGVLIVAGCQAGCLGTLVPISRRQVSDPADTTRFWIPACAGMTNGALPRAHRNAPLRCGPRGRAEWRSPSALFLLPQEWGLRGLKGWGLTRAGHERYVSLQAKLRSGTDTPAGRSGLECNHNIRLLSEDTPLLSQESPHKWAFFFCCASPRAWPDGWLTASWAGGAC